MNHEIRTVEGSNHPHSERTKLSPSELMTTKEYVTDLLRNENIRHRKNIYGEPLCVIYRKRKLRAVIY